MLLLDFIGEPLFSIFFYELDENIGSSSENSSSTFLTLILGLTDNLILAFFFLFLLPNPN